jgi:sialidase-1
MAFENIVVYKGSDHHSAFPEIIRLQNGELLTLFRQAPVRPGNGIKGDPYEMATHYHKDTSSRSALVRSLDDGETWDPSTFVIVDPADHKQDHNMGMIVQVSSGEILVNNLRLFADLDDETAEWFTGKRTLFPFAANRAGGAMAFDSLYMIRSNDNGHTWGAPQHFGVDTMDYWSHTGQTGIVELPDGTWIAPFHGSTPSDETDRSFVARSSDGGQTWGQATTVAYDPEQRISFHEPPLLRLSNGRLLTVIRTAGADDYMYQAFSTDDGWTWQGLKKTPMWGDPCNIIELRSGRILCTYGYRREPYGVRACFSNDQGETWDIGREVVLRDDGEHMDLGYPASIERKDGSILSTYYFHGDDCIRFIGGSIWSDPNA